MASRSGIVAAVAFSATAFGGAPLAAQDWNGAYYGASLGFGSGSYAQGVAALDQTGVDVDVSGLVYGGHAGVNFQNGDFLFGVDAGVSAGPGGATAQGTEGEDFTCRSGECFVDINYIGTVRGKVGYVTDIRTVVYAAAGLAIAAVDGGIANSDQEGSSTASGFTYAVGVERITSPFSTIFAEAGYYDLGTLTFGTNEGADPPPATVEDFTADGDFFAIRAGINFKF